jgi:hypothetical protein
MSMNRRFFLVGAGIALASPAFAKCKSGWQQCDAVPDNAFGRGTIKRPADCRLRFKLPSELLGGPGQGIVRNHRDPTGPAGTYDWTLRLITFDRNGRPRWQEKHKVINQPYKDQGIYFGTVAATYITCDQYTGWYSTGPIRSCGQPVLRRVGWGFDWKQLDKALS